MNGQGREVQLQPILVVDRRLKRLRERTSLSERDLLNRAVTVSEMLDSALSAGDEVLVRDNCWGELLVLRMHR